MINEKRTGGKSDEAGLFHPFFSVIILEILIGLLTINPLFTFLGAEGQVLVLIGDYMRLWYVAIGFFIITMMSNNIIRAAGDAKFPGIVMMVSALINLIWTIPLLTKDPSAHMLNPTIRRLRTLQK